MTKTSSLIAKLQQIFNVYANGSTAITNMIIQNERWLREEADETPLPAFIEKDERTTETLHIFDEDTDAPIDEDFMKTTRVVSLELYNYLR